MNKQQERDVYIIPPNFIDTGTFFGGMFKARNVIEAGILTAAIGLPVLFRLPFSLTMRIVVLCLTALPAALIALIGIDGESLTAFLYLFLKFGKNRRIVGGTDEELQAIAEKQERRKKHTLGAKNKKEQPPAFINPAAEYIPTLPSSEKKGGFDAVIVADLQPDDKNLRNMIADFQAVYPYQTRLVNLAEYPFQGGCLGCFHCAGVGKCVYKDNFDTFLRENIQKADAVVYAFTIRDHSMGPVFKTYDDRQFCNGHRTVTEGMPFGNLINGDLDNEPNLRTIIEARCEVGHNFLAGTAASCAEISTMVQRLSYGLEHRYVQPRNFYGVGGMKIFRDLIWMMRGLMKADHNFYKAHGIYDFPQKQRGKMLMMCLLGAMVRNPKINAKMGNKMNEGMVAPYKKVIAAANPKPGFDK